jgi:hypothetical protein
MKFRGAALIGVEEVEPGSYVVLGRAMPLSRKDIRELAAIHAAAERRSRLILDDGEFIEFLGLRDHLKQLADLYGDPSFLLQPWLIQKPIGPHHVSCDKAMGRLKNPNAAVFETEFGIGTDGEFARKPPQDRQSIIVTVPFEEADELVAAMSSGTFLFSSAALFSSSPPDPNQIASALAKAPNLATFQSALLAAFPTIYAYNVNEDEFRIMSRDRDFVDNVTAAIGRSTL